MVDVSKLKDKLEYLKSEEGKKDPLAVYKLADIVKVALDEIDRMKGEPKKVASNMEKKQNPPNLNTRQTPPPGPNHNFK